MVLAFPLTIDPAGSVMSSGVDTNLFIWTVGWNAHALLHRPLALFEANTFFPFHDSLAYSENLLGSSVIAAPILWMRGSPVLAMNAVALSSIPLSAIGALVLARELGASRHAAIVAGIVFGFAPPRFFRLDQLHLTTVQWIPFALAFAHAYLRGGRASDLRLAIAFFTLQALCSGHGAVFLTVALAALLLIQFVAGTLPPLGRVPRDIGFVGLVLLLPALAVFVPYQRVQAEMDLRRGLEDFRIVSWQSFLASPSHLHRWLVDTLIPDANVIGLAGAYLFPGITPLLLAALALIPRRSDVHTVRGSGRFGAIATAFAVALELTAILTIAIGLSLAFSGPIRWRVGDVVLLSAREPIRVWLVAAVSIVARLMLRRRVSLNPLARSRMIVSALHRARAAVARTPVPLYGLLTVVCVWLSCAPPFGLWPYVYWLPGFDFIRAPSRFMILGVLGLAVLAAIGFDRLTGKLSASGRAIALGLVTIVMAAEFSAAPLGLVRDDNQIPAVDRWLASQPDPLVVAEAPVDPRVLERDLQQSIYMRHSMAHWHRTVHGYSGIHPPLTEGLYEHLTQFPETETIRALQSVGVTTVVVHLDGYPPADRDEMLRRIANQPALKLEHSEGEGRIYSLIPASGSS